MRVLFGWLLVIDIRIVSPLPARCRYSAQLEGSDNLLVALSRTPLLDGARAGHRLRSRRLDSHASRRQRR